MKRFAIAAIVAAGILSAAAFSGCSGGTAEVVYKLSEDGTHYVVSGVEGNKNSLTEYQIPREYAAEEGGQALPVTEIGKEAFIYCEMLSSVTIPDSVTVIAENAFSYCGFTQVEIPDSVKTIRRGAFGGCENLKEVTVPQSVTVLESRAFAYCTNLETVRLKAQVTVLEDRVFYNSAPTHAGNVYTNSKLSKVYLPKTLKKIHRDALAGNPITDFYFEGSEEEWGGVTFFYTELKEGTEDVYEEKTLDKEQIMQGVKMHYNTQI